MGDALGLRGRDRDRNEAQRRGAVMLPNFIMIGAAKAGTTALYWYLAEHPQVFMSPMKETNYFAYGLDEQGHLLYGDPELHRFRVQSWSEYEALFTGAGDAAAIGEVSPIYLECPQAAARIRQRLPGARIVCGLREPVDRAYSDFRDHRISANPGEMTKLVQRVRQAEAMLGEPVKRVQPCELDTIAACERERAFRVSRLTC